LHRNPFGELLDMGNYPHGSALADQFVEHRADDFQGLGVEGVEALVEEYGFQTGRGPGEL
jgi:hypothetical protein